VLFTRKRSKYLCLLRLREAERMLSRQIIDEIKIVAHPVGKAEAVSNRSM